MTTSLDHCIDVESQITLCGMLLYGMVLHSTVWYCTVWYCTVRYGTARYGIAQYGIRLVCKPTRSVHSRQNSYHTCTMYVCQKCMICMWRYLCIMYIYAGNTVVRDTHNRKLCIYPLAGHGYPGSRDPTSRHPAATQPVPASQSGTRRPFREPINGLGWFTDRPMRGQNHGWLAATNQRRKYRSERKGIFKKMERKNKLRETYLG